jgi:two-component system CheB/CheR fusion protein
MNDSHRPTIVGIGASAGGLDALKQFFSSTPSDSGLAYVVIVHLTPEHPSMLADLLQPFVAMPVQQVTANVAIEADNVYVIPPGRNLSTIDSHLRLSDIEAQRRNRAPIDHFFDTLAQTHGEHCVGVVLSGTGADGTVGISMIKERGGLTIAQEPGEAQFDSMPQSAIATGLIDLVLPVREMPAHILRFMRIQPRIELADDLKDQPKHDRQVLHHIFGQVRARAGQDFSRYKQSTVLRRIRRRMQLHQIEQLGDYLELLREDPAEVHALADELLITVTQFFRDPETFGHLEKEIIPGLFQDKSGGDRIRVWSVGCATGEEAYSIAMLLLEQAARQDNAPQIEIFASELHEGSLKRAREGLYPDTIEAYVSPERLRRFFVKEDGIYRVRKEVREVVVFAAHNLLKDPPFSRLDLVICRNLLIYLQRETQDKVIDLFHYALKPGGLLWLGPAETIDRTALFQPESKRDCLYRRRNVPPPEPRLPVFPAMRRQRQWVEIGAAQHEPAPSYGALHQRMVERWAPPSILVDQDNRIVHSSEHAGRYLRVPGGEPSANVFKLVHEALRIELRAALHAAAERGEPVRTDPIALSLDGKQRHVVLQVRPSQDAELGGLGLVIFDEMDVDESGPASQHNVAAEERSELDRTKERLRTVIEQYETSQEEMTAANEELQSTNEELRSTLEELETSKEELQSMNEELQTVNQENRHKVEELSQLTSDLNNLMAATDIATLFLDRELRILRVTPRAGQLFHIRNRDRGRPLTDLRRLVAYEQLEEDARSVFETLTPVQREVQGEDGDWYLTRVLPYRSATDHIQGIVITLVEITQLKDAELALRDSEERFRALVTASAQIVWTTDAAGQVVEDSPSWRAFTGQTIEQWRGEGWADAVHPDDRARVLDNWQRCTAEEQPLNIEFRLQHRSGGWRWTHVRAVPLRDGAGRVRGWVGMCTDITERKRSEETLLADDRRKDEFLATLGHELRNPLAPMRTAMELFKELLPAAPEIRRLSAMIERQVEHLTRLVDDLLDVARIKSGRIKLQRSHTDLRGLVRAAISDLRGSIEAAGHRLSTDQANELLYVDADEVRLVQVFTNLLHNAIKYTPAGGDIAVTTRREHGDAVVSIRDSGIGIAPEMLTQVFDLFAQGARDPERAPSGLGLGLTLVRRLVELHGGSVDAHSAGPGKGTEIIVRLPLAAQRREQRSSDATAKADNLPRAAKTTAAQRRVLVVDDVVDIATSLALALELAGHEVRQAGDAKQALAIVDGFAPDVVILDIGLPDMDGYALARALRERPATADARLIAVSGYGQEDDRDKSAAAGIDYHLAKPADLKELLGLIGG